jgi:hypothetical protein
MAHIRTGDQKDVAAEGADGPGDGASDLVEVRVSRVVRDAKGNERDRRPQILEERDLAEVLAGASVVFDERRRSG